MEKETKNLGFLSSAETSSPQINNNNRLRKYLLNYRLWPAVQLHISKRPTETLPFSLNPSTQKNPLCFVSVLDAFQFTLFFYPDEKWVESPGAESLHSPSLNLCPWNSEAPGGLEREEALLNVCFFTASPPCVLPTYSEKR